MDEESKEMEKVAKLIALKRYEQPPPGYFHLLPGRIMTRIEKGEGRPSFWEGLAGSLAIRPALAYAFGLGVCCAVTVGMFYAPKSTTTANVTVAMPDTTWALAQSVDAADESSAAPEGLHVVNWLGSTSPVTATETASAFETQPDRPMLLPVSWDK